jgi:hypothetical protein
MSILKFLHKSRRSVSGGYGTITGLAPPPAEIRFIQDFLTALTIKGGSGSDTLNIAQSPQYYFGPTSVTYNGGGGINTLLGPNSANTWKITGPNVGTAGNVAFAAVQKFVGGQGVDVFQFTSGAKCPRSTAAPPRRTRATGSTIQP